jgi:hypothetical protein
MSMPSPLTASLRRALRSSLLPTLLTLSPFPAVAPSLLAQPPPLRWEVSLAGDWPVGGTVPLYGGEPTAIDHRTYMRMVQVPPSFAGRRVRLEFEAVNFAADLFINGRPVASHVGAWNPFAVDITDLVAPGESFELRLEVEGMRGPRTVGSDGWERWPVGTPALDGRWTGIADDIWLRAYGEVHVADAFIRSDVAAGRLHVDYTLVNTTTAAQTVSLQARADAWPASHPSAPWEWPALPFTLPPGETRVVTVELPFAHARRWTPDTPHLYVLHTTLRRANTVVDEERRRFGYRQFTVSGERFALNGVPTTLRGDYIGYGAYIPVAMQQPETLAATYRRLKSELNANALRWHLRPPPRYAYELADEVGLFLVAESAVYGRPDPRAPMPADVKAEFLANVHRWLGPWIRARRNHPSVVMWSVVNEMGPKYRNHQGLTPDELRAVGAIARALDPTRPLVYHGNAEVRDEDTVNYHYPTLAPETAESDIYWWRRLLVPGKPTGLGEYFQTSATARPLGDDPAVRARRAQEAKDWMAHFTRGLRHLGFADLRPKLINWTLHEPEGSWRVSTMRDTFAPVALFDLDYDRLGLAPIRDGTLPRVAVGQQLVRRLRLYNEEWSGDLLDVIISVVRDGREHYRHAGQIHLAPGHQRDWMVSVPVPADAGPFAIVREVLKDGRPRFIETSHFIAQ